MYLRLTQTAKEKEVRTNAQALRGTHFSIVVRTRVGYFFFKHTSVVGK